MQILSCSEEYISYDRFRLLQEKENISLPIVYFISSCMIRKTILWQELTDPYYVNDVFGYNQNLQPYLTEKHCPKLINLLHINGRYSLINTKIAINQAFIYEKLNAKLQKRWKNMLPFHCQSEQ